MAHVAHVLQAKGHQIWSIAPQASVFDAIKLMADKEVGALLVMDGDDLVGIISERDYARKVILKGKSSHDTQVREIMTDKVVYVGPERTVEDCMAVMTARRIRHLPVLVDNRPIGVISIGDLVKAQISEHEVRIQQLENYIAGRM
jgi:CBS domain-containing protein